MIARPVYFYVCAAQNSCDGHLAKVRRARARAHYEVRATRFWRLLF